MKALLPAVLSCFIVAFACMSNPVFSQSANNISQDTAKAAALVRQADTLCNIKNKCRDAIAPLDIAEKIYQQTGTTESYGYSEVMINKGVAYSRLQKQDSGFICLKEAERLKRKFAPNSMRLSTTLMSLMPLYAPQDLNISLALGNEAFTIQNQLLGEKNMWTNRTLNNIAICHRLMGNLDKAIETYLKVLNNTPKEDLILSPSVYGNLANCYNDKGDENRALLYFLKSEALTKDKSSEFAGYLNSLINIGNAYSSKNEFNQALNYYNRALALLKETPQYLLQLRTVYSSLGILYKRKGEYDQAIAFQQKTIEVMSQKAYPQENGPDISNSEIGVCYGKKGNLVLADSYQRLALNNSLSKKNKNERSIAFCYLTLGDNARMQKQFELANVYFDSAKYFLRYDINNLGKSTRIAYLQEVLKAQSLTSFEQYEQTKDLNFLNQSKALSDQALAVLTYQDAQTTFTQTKIQLNTEGYPTIETAIQIALTSAELNKNEADKRAAFDLSERAKALVLFQNVRDETALSFAGLPDSLLIAERQLRIDLSYYEKQQQDLFLKGKTTATDTNLLVINSKLFDKKNQYDQLKAQLQRDYPNYYHLRYDRRTMTVAEVQKEILQPKQTLLEYFAGDSNITIFTIRRDKYDVTIVKNDFGLDSLVRQLRTSLTTDRSQGARGYSDAASLLYQKLIAPVKAQLTEEVIIIPDGILSYIPFEALLVESPKEVVRFKTHHYLLRDHRISYCFSATLLREMMQKKHATPPTVPLMAFAPFFEGDTIQLSALFSNDADIALERDAITLAPLKYTGEEAYKVAQLLKGEAIVGKAATVTRFTEGVAKARILHLATHAKADDRSGDYSYLAFAPQKDAIQNELVYVRDLYNLRLNADLVVLSACETGVGKLQRGEGVISLARAFAYSGAKAIVTSIWSVNDAKTKDLMVFFYQNLKRGQPKNEALRQAKLTYLETHTAEACHPYFWSGFVSIGEQSAVR